MNPQRRKHFAILVHHGNSKRTHRALSSLIDCPLPPDKIIIIDHAKQPYRAAHHNSCRVIRPQQNNGYAAGINIGLGILISLNIKEHDIVIVTNNDIIVSPLALQQLRKWWQDNPADALLGTSIMENSQTLAGDGHVNLLTGRTHLHPLSQDAPTARPGRNVKRAPPTAPASAERRRAGRPGCVEYIHGAFFSAPYRVFMRTKGLPEHYFLYWEDVLFSQRVKQAGIPLFTTNTVTVTHQQRKHSKDSRDHLYYLVRNGALFLAEETSLPWRQYWRLSNRLRLLYHTLKPHCNPIVKLALRDAIRGVTGPRTKTTTDQS